LKGFVKNGNFYNLWNMYVYKICVLWLDQALESTDALKQAAIQAHQLELKKKLDEGEREQFYHRCTGIVS
jgi:hypothetical protein